MSVCRQAIVPNCRQLIQMAIYIATMKLSTKYTFVYMLFSILSSALLNYIVVHTQLHFTTIVVFNKCTPFVASGLTTSLVY